MAHDIAQIPARAERELVEAVRSLYEQGFHSLGLIRAQGIGGGTAEYLLDAQKTDKCQDKYNRNNNYNAEQRHTQTPIRHIKICSHRAVRVHDIPCNQIAECRSENGADDTDRKGI